MYQLAARIRRLWNILAELPDHPRRPGGRKGYLEKRRPVMPTNTKQGRKFDRCVEEVKESGHARNPYAVCNSNAKTKRPKTKKSS
jgi:hypothetical protein